MARESRDFMITNLLFALSLKPPGLRTVITFSFLFHFSATISTRLITDVIGAWIEK